MLTQWKQGYQMLWIDAPELMVPPGFAGVQTAQQSYQDLLLWTINMSVQTLQQLQLQHIKRSKNRWFSFLGLGVVVFELIASKSQYLKEKAGKVPCQKAEWLLPFHRLVLHRNSKDDEYSDTYKPAPTEAAVNSANKAGKTNCSLSLLSLSENWLQFWPV